MSPDDRLRACDGTNSPCLIIPSPCTLVPFESEVRRGRGYGPDAVSRALRARRNVRGLEENYKDYFVTGLRIFFDAYPNFP